MSLSQITPSVTIENLSARAGRPGIAEDILEGLARPLKEVPPKYFYDEEGAILFDRICELPEYYPTRTEAEILREWSAEIAGRTGASELVELGSGYATKTRLLLAEMAAAGNLRRYVPVDVTEAVVLDVAENLTAHYPNLSVHGIIGDFERDLNRIPDPDGPRIVAFLGGTLGNFPPAAREGFLRNLASLLRPEDTLLIGHDLVKDPSVIEAAYNDSAGVTATFNRNVLKVINDRLGGDFEPSAFEHVAFFNREEEWIEMRLRAERDMQVKIESLDLEISFARGEEIRTEISAKFTPERLNTELGAAGLVIEELLVDGGGLYGLSLSRTLN